VAGADGAEHIELIRRVSDAVDAGDEATLRTLCDEDVEYMLVSQGSYKGIEEYVARSMIESQSVHVTRDLFTADGSGRVWWRFTARWNDAETGRARRATGATVAHIEGHKVTSFMSWIDVIAAGVDDD